MTPLPRYHELLRNAYGLSEEVDLFDLDGNDPESVRLFNLLELDNAKAQRELIDHVVEHREALLDLSMPR